jgi:hypothetical protein
MQTFSNPAVQFHAFWDPGVLWGTIAMLVVVVITFVGGIIFIEMDKGNRGWDFLVWLGVLVVEFAIVALILFPFQSAYLRYVPVTGKVQQVTSRFLSNGNNSGSTQKFAVMLTNGDIYGCDDTRCSAVVSGDTITMLCEKTWQLGGPAGYDCQWGDAVSPKGEIIGGP